MKKNTKKITYVLCYSCEEIGNESVEHYKLPTNIESLMSQLGAELPDHSCRNLDEPSETIKCMCNCKRERV